MERLGSNLRTETGLRPRERSSNPTAARSRSALLHGSAGSPACGRENHHLLLRRQRLALWRARTLGQVNELRGRAARAAFHLCYGLLRRHQGRDANRVCGCLPDPLRTCRPPTASTFGGTQSGSFDAGRRRFAPQSRGYPDESWNRKKRHRGMVNPHFAIPVHRMARR